MKLAIDVGYHEHGATAAGVLFEDWKDPKPADEISVVVKDVQPYEPGQFYKRELPCMIALLEQVESPIDTIIVDGFVWLSKNDTAPKPGLGAYLYEHLNQEVPIIGVAKTEFVGAGAAELLRGNSSRPLFVSTAGVDVIEAIHAIKLMHGEHRIPQLLKRADSLSRIEPLE